MAKKTHKSKDWFLKKNLIVPFLLRQKPAGGEKAKIKLKAKKYNPSTKKHEIFC